MSAPLPHDEAVEQLWSFRGVWTSLWMTLTMTFWQHEQKEDPKWVPEAGVGDWKGRLAALYGKSVEEMEGEDDEAEADEDEGEKSHLPQRSTADDEEKELEDAELFAKH